MALPSIEVTGINIAPKPDFSKKYTVVAFGDINLPELGLRLYGVALGRAERQWVAMAPKARGANPRDKGLVSWNWHSSFAQAVRDKLIAAYERMEGPLPVFDTPADVNAANGLRRILEARHAA